MVLNNNINEYWFKAADKLNTYYFTIEAVNEKEDSAEGEVLKMK